MINISKINFKNSENNQYTSSHKKAPVYTDPFENKNAQMTDSFIREQKKQEKRANLMTMAAVGTFIAFAVMAISSVATHRVNKRAAEEQININKRVAEAQINAVVNETNQRAANNSSNQVQILSQEIKGLLESLIEKLYSGKNIDDEFAASIKKEFGSAETDLSRLIDIMIKDVKEGKEINEKLAEDVLNRLYKCEEPTKAQMDLGYKTSEQIKAMFTDVSDAKSFEELKMSKKMQEELDRIVDHIQRAETYEEYMQEVENAIMFYGPPGTGKTTFVLALCKKLGIKPFIYNMGQLKGGYQGVVEANMDKASEVFIIEHKKARLKNPKHISIMFFDECDEIFQKPKGGNENSDNQILTRFKNGYNKWKAEKGVYIFGNTNKSPEELEDAMGDRIKGVYIDRPNWKSLSDNFFNHYAKGGDKIAADLKNPSDRSDKFFKILAREEHKPSFREMIRTGWTGIKVPEDGRQLTLNDIIQNAISRQQELGFSEGEISELKSLLQ